MPAGDNPTALGTCATRPGWNDASRYGEPMRSGDLCDPAAPKAPAAPSVSVRPWAVANPWAPAASEVHAGNGDPDPNTSSALGAHLRESEPLVGRAPVAGTLPRLPRPAGRCLSRRHRAPEGQPTSERLGALRSARWWGLGCSSAEQLHRAAAWTSEKEAPSSEPTQDVLPICTMLLKKRSKVSFRSVCGGQIWSISGQLCPISVKLSVFVGPMWGRTWSTSTNFGRHHHNFGQSVAASWPILAESGPSLV